MHSRKAAESGKAMLGRIILGVAFLLAFATPALGDDIVAQKHKTDQAIGQLQDRLSSQKRDETALRGQIADVTSRIRSLEGQVGDVSLRLSTLQADLALHRRRLAEAERPLQPPETPRRAAEAAVRPSARRPLESTRFDLRARPALDPRGHPGREVPGRRRRESRLRHARRQGGSQDRRRGEASEGVDADRPRPHESAPCDRDRGGADDHRAGSAGAGDEGRARSRPRERWTWPSRSSSSRSRS